MPLLHSRDFRTWNNTIVYMIQFLESKNGFSLLLPSSVRRSELLCSVTPSSITIIVVPHFNNDPGTCMLLLVVCDTTYLQVILTRRVTETNDGLSPLPTFFAVMLYPGAGFCEADQWLGEVHVKHLSLFLFFSVIYLILRPKH